MPVSDRGGPPLVGRLQMSRKIGAMASRLFRCGNLLPCDAICVQRLPQSSVWWFYVACLLIFVSLVVGSYPARAEKVLLAPADVLDLPPEVRQVDVAGHIFILQDPAGRMTIEDVMGKYDKFRAIPGTFNASFTPESAWWLRTTLRPAAGQGKEWILQIVAPYVDVIDVYVPSHAGAGSRLVHSRTGALVPPRERERMSHLYAVSLDLVGGQDQDIYVRVAGSRSLSASLSLWKEDGFSRLVISHALTVAFIVGAAGITALGAIIFGLWLRLPAFVWYGAYLGFAGLVVLGNSGVATFLLDRYEPSTVLRLQGVIGCMTVMTGAFVVRAIFCENGKHKLPGLVLAGIGVFAGCGALVSLVGYYGRIAPAMHGGLLIICLLLPWLAAQKLMRREPAAGWYFIGFTAYGLTGIWFCLMVFGLLPMSAIGEKGYQLMSVLNMGTVFVGLATSVRAGARERRQLQVQLLEASRQNTRELEEAVAQRTSALESEVEARRAAEQALIVAMREQRHFLGIVSHEFRTPLGSIRVAISTIERRLLQADDVARREATRIVQMVGRLAHLIDAFLADEVLDRRDLQPRLSSVDMFALAHEICQDNTIGYQGPVGAESSDGNTVQADLALLRIAIQNLVDNAIRYGSEPVLLHLQQTPDMIGITVSDSGPGIPAHEHEAIFERYYRAITPHARSGAGIGLSLVRKIARLHGGRVEVESQPGEGSRFTIWLPCRSAETPAFSVAAQ